jgi:enterochelin esterase-like enzyme
VLIERRPNYALKLTGYRSAVGEGASEEGVEVTGRELIREIIPFIEKHYRVVPSAESRAIAGLSMGATQALMAGLRHLDTFA